MIPYRTTGCLSATENKIFFGGCFGNQSNISWSYKYPNTTQIPDDAGTLINIPLRYGTSCAPCSPSGNPYINDHQWLCGPWPLLFSDSGGSDVHVPTNTFVSSSETQSYSTCNNYGFNTVQAGRQWHGIYPFSYDRASGLNCDGTDGASYVKYQSMKVEISGVQAINFKELVYELPEDGGHFISHQEQVYSGGWSLEYQTTVNDTSGELTIVEYPNTPASMSCIYTSYDEYDTVVTTYSGSTSGGFLVGFLPNYLNVPFINPDGYWNDWEVLCPCDPSDPNVQVGSGYQRFAGPLSTMNNFYTSSLHWPTDVSSTVNALGVSTTNSLTDTTFEFTITISGGTCDNSGTEGRTAVHTYTSTLLGDTKVHFKVTLSNPKYLNTHTSGSVKDGIWDDLQSLLGTWMLDNPQHFPTWRRDLNTTTAPFVSRNELSVQSPYQFPPQYVDDYSKPLVDGIAQQMLWYDAACYTWVFPYDHPSEYGYGTLYKTVDGNVLGQPLALGYGGTCISHSQRGCYDYTQKLIGYCGDTPQLEEKSYGDWTPTFLPAHCPKWTPGVNIDDTHGLTDILWSCAFTTNNIYNYSVYAQKWAETLVRPPNGSYNFTRPYGADRLLLDYTHADDCDGVVVVDVDGNPMPLRYPNCPGFGGRVKVSYSASALIFTPFFNTIQVGDRLDIYDSSMGIIANAIPIISASSTQVNISGSYVNATYMVASGSKYYWDDNGYKGNYVTRTWELDGADTALTTSQAQSCLSLTTCAPSVVCFSPNGESFKNGTTYSMSMARRNHSNLYQVEQWMADPLFKQSFNCDTLTLNVECYTDCADYGTCENLVPQVEAMCYLPATSGSVGFGQYQNEQAQPLPDDAIDFTEPMGPPNKGGGILFPWWKYDTCYAG